MATGSGDWRSRFAFALECQAFPGHRYHQGMWAAAVMSGAESRISSSEHGGVGMAVLMGDAAGQRMTDHSCTCSCWLEDCFV